MIRNKLILKPLSVLVVGVFLFQIFYPTTALALTGGPSQPETQSFMAADVTDMVDPFSGDFSYNIPLMDVGGYPINLSYRAGATMDEEASWVGLGWNINPGAINRNVRGLPDDFKGDMVDKHFYVKPNQTFGASGLGKLEIAGLDLDRFKSEIGLSVGIGARYNNYSGIGLDYQIHPSIGSSEANKSRFTASLGLSIGTSGVGVSPSVSFSSRIESKMLAGTSMATRLGSSFNSRTGLQAITLQSSLTEQSKISDGQFSISMLSSKLSFATPTYTPTIKNSFVNKSLSLSLSFGTEILASDGSIETQGYYSGQFLKYDSVESPSYGYLYYQEGSNAPDGVLDFNREKDVGFSEEVKNLPLTAATYDIFSVSGEGIGGSYRLFRNDVGSLYDNNSSNESGDISLGGPELSGGNLVKGGANVAVNTSTTTGGKWQIGNSTYSSLKFKKKTLSHPSEPVYFRKSGEKNVMSNETFFNAFGGFDAISANLDYGTELLSAKKEFTTSKEEVKSIPSENLNTERQARNETIIHYTAEESELFGTFNKVREYKKNDFYLQSDGTYKVEKELIPYQLLGNNSFISRKKHHLSEIQVYSSDGRRYVYADPIYNYYKEEVTFAINGQSTNNKGTITYRKDIDDVRKNNNGLDHYYDKVVTPAYPTSFLLSTILSSDYVDVDEVKGPSDEDLGNYTKFNYATITNKFKWRTPFAEDQASYNEGFHTKSGKTVGDNKASYVYGYKDLKYLHSIETKTHIAEFELGSPQNNYDREDGYEVFDKHGGKGSDHLQNLVEIRLYSKEDKLKDPINAVPIKTVHFKYDYILCKQVDNYGGNDPVNRGKLTLTEVYFTYGKSSRARLSPYVFTYGERGATTVNYDYDTKDIDRWGNYQPNDGNPGNEYFPFTDQSKDVDGDYYADIYASNWNLTTIQLPSGGEIKVVYESDDYAYVQDKKAMQMFKIKKIGNSTTNNQLYDGSGSAVEITVELPTSEYAELSADDFLRENGKLIENLYFKTYINIEDPAEKEYVTGYAELDVVSWQPSLSSNGLVFRVKKIDQGNNDRHPFTVATFNFLKRHFPAIAYDQPQIDDSGVLQVFDALLGAFKSLRQFAAGIDDDLHNRGIGKYIDLDKSWVRLYNPLSKKKGGGHRVKTIQISDNWDGMTNGVHSPSVYGQEYTYTMQDDFGNTISSGVAGYEPILGNEENPLRQPRFYDIDKLLVPDEEFYLEEPMGEFFFPGASVGYRKVTVKSLDVEGVVENSTGKTVHEFYTSYDFPTITDEVPIKISRKKPNSILKLLKLAGKDYVSASQGYVVELNDMHGKPKAQWQYQENDISYYSGVEYKYKQLSAKQIASRDLIINKSGKIEEKYIGVEMDLVADIRQSKTVTISSSHNFNVDAFIAVIVPIVLPTYWPTFSKEEVRFNSIVYNKVIKRHGLLKETIYYDQKSQVGATNNILRDAESGEVLLSQSVNAYNDPVYSFNYPAYWAYDHMGPVYKNADISIEADNIQTLNKYLKVGDKVVILDNGTSQIAWISVIDGSSVKYIDKDGLSIKPSPTNIIRVIKPSRTNQQAQSMGSIIAKVNPLVDNNSDGIPEALVFDKVLQATVTEFTEQASVFCNCNEQVEGVPFNPFTRGTKGIWKPWREFNYIADRTQTRRNDNVDTRNDGSLTEFTPFWTASPVVGQDWLPNYQNWIYTAEASIFNPYGKELESRDALGRFSSAIFGYNHSLPVAVAKNAKYQHIAFDGFEDYGTEDCGDDHFSYEQIAIPSKLTDAESHSGRKSILVEPDSIYSLRKVLIECNN